MKLLMKQLLLLFSGFAWALTLFSAQTGSDLSGQVIHGMTISTQTSGREWASDGLEKELDRLQAMGINWITIHPYARVRGDGSVQYRELDPKNPPAWLVRPIKSAHARGMQILIKPHLAYWGSPFSWRGEIAFAEPEKQARFWKGFSDWTLDLASAAVGADGFCVGTELELQVDRKADWIDLITKVRKRTDAQLSYASNWDGVNRVTFWEALDAIGVQAYFPLPAALGPDGIPTSEALREAWQPHLSKLRKLSKSVGKPVIFAELGYDQTESTNLRPWEGAARRKQPSEAARLLQIRCFEVAFEVLEEESEWLRGAFLWKWFIGPSGHEDFKLDHPGTRQLIQAKWGQGAKGQAGAGSD